jgi:MinD superfamily P-loop ATPase
LTVRVVVASGKGGTGKTTIAVNLALSGTGAQLLDCDVEEPDGHLFVGSEGEPVGDVTLPVARVDESVCSFCGECARACQFNAIAVLSKHVMVFDQLCHGCGACTVACPEDAIFEESRRIGELRRDNGSSFDLMWGVLDVGEPMATPIIRRLKEVAGDSGFQILDAPPGTACPVVETLRGTDYCVLVTEPTPFGRHDLGLAVDLIRELRLPCGVVVNRDRDDGGALDFYLEKQGIEVLMRIPDSLEIARLYARGIPFTEEMPSWRHEFHRLFEDLSKESSS